MAPELGNAAIGAALAVAGLGGASIARVKARRQKVSIAGIRTLYRVARWWWCLARAADAAWVAWHREKLAAEVEPDAAREA